MVVIHKGDAAYLSDISKSTLEDFFKRGGGLDSLHNSLCGPDPACFSTLVGGARRHGEITYKHHLAGGKPARAWAAQHPADELVNYTPARPLWPRRFRANWQEVNF